MTRAGLAVLAAVLALAGAPLHPQETKSEASVPANTAPPPPGSDETMPVPPPEPPLPAIPPPPRLDTQSYPACREDWQKEQKPFARADATNRCVRTLDQYYAQVMVPFVKAMAAHQDAVAALYSKGVAHDGRYSEITKQAFYKAVLADHAKSDPDGPYMADYRTTLVRYKQDRAYLQDRFCFNAGCGAYATAKPAAQQPAPAPAATKSAKADRATSRKRKAAKGDGCGGARKTGGVLGGLIGGLAGSASGLNGVGTAIASGVGGVLVGEIACKLTRQEQEKAAEATEKVTEEAQVGATATWQSPTRSGVSGSSTVTALNAEPNGRKCLNITDVAIVDGEETRVSKRMCRGPGESRYSIVA